MVVFPFKMIRFWYCPLPLVVPVIFHVPEPDAPVTNSAPPMPPPLVPSKVISALLTMPPLKVISEVDDGANFKLPKLTVVAPV